LVGKAQKIDLVSLNFSLSSPIGWLTLST